LHAADQLPLQTRSGYSSYTHDMRGVTIVSLLLRGGEKKKKRAGEEGYKSASFRRREFRHRRKAEGVTKTEE
jgi:hypothetical protein